MVICETFGILVRKLSESARLLGQTGYFGVLTFKTKNTLEKMINLITKQIDLMHMCVIFSVFSNE